MCSRSLSKSVYADWQRRTRHALWVEAGELTQPADLYLHDSQRLELEKLRSYYIDILMLAGYERDEAELSVGGEQEREQGQEQEQKKEQEQE